MEAGRPGRFRKGRLRLLGMPGGTLARVLHPFASATDRARLAGLERELSRPGAPKVIMWPGLERQEGQVLDAFDALVVRGLTRGAILRLQGFLSRRVMTFPRLDRPDLGRENGVLELVLPSVPRSARRARGLVQAVTATRDLSDSARHDVALAVGEALANAIQHGSPRGAADSIALRLTLFDSGLVIQVLDHGCWGEEVLHEETPSVCGRGLMLMRQLLDDVEVSSAGGGTVVSMFQRYEPDLAGG